MFSNLRYLFCLSGLFFVFPAFSQNLKGHITDIHGEPLPAVSIYIKENKQGLIANHSGEFQAKLAPGTYHLEVHCIGFESDTREISLTDSEVELTVVLKEKDFQLKEVEIRWTEDPAYEIIRQAIKMAPYYQSAVSESTYKSYNKGSGKMTHIPQLIRSLSKGTLEPFIDKLFLLESVTEMKFTAPDKYEQKVVAYSSTFPDMNDPQAVFDMGRVSLYRPIFSAGTVSPLNPKTFDYYRFRYEGYEEENGRIINKIRIIPKLKDPKLMEGFIYIADEEWNIRHAELTLSPLGMTSHVKLNYCPVVDNIYLLCTNEMKLNVHLGMNMEANFLSSIQYTHIQLNDSLIAARGKTNLPKKKKERKSLEIKDDDFFKRTVDSMAVKRDSLYWSTVRSIVLNEEELQSYARKDTMQQLVDSLNRKEEDADFEFSDLLFGGRIGNDSSFVRIRYPGLLFAFPEYNFADGVWMGQALSLNFKQKKHTGLIINPSVYWASAREKWLWKTDIYWDYAPKRLGQLHLSAGKTSKDFSREMGMDRFINSLYSLAGGRNFARFYDKKYFRINNRIDIANGLPLTLGYEMAVRKELENQTTWNLFNIRDRWSPNVPEYGKPMYMKEYERLAEYSIHLEYTPEYYYRMEKGVKKYVRSRFPTIGVDYRQGFAPDAVSGYSVFSRMEMSIRQQMRLSVFSRLNYTLTAGKFFNTNPFNYIDYKHFDSGSHGVSFKDWKTSYALLPYYTYSTNRQWVQAFVNYDTDYLALKRLPFLQGKLFTEALHAKFLHTPDKPGYSEWGYSVNLPGNIGGFGVFAAFDSFDYTGVGLQVSLPLFKLFGGKGGKDETIMITIEY
ncbi:MAG: DUF5686 and carboxypeptidase regulatory-like domain-containing protein [Dysgonamonadaceae bacterium]|jgi:hypothetical protein|nr:DUF5686 and carboxypeptidase regulatory-like domain-containing protein [Dysgonamonadaceae bacterium]